MAEFWQYNDDDRTRLLKQSQNSANEKGWVQPLKVSGVAEWGTEI